MAFFTALNSFKGKFLHQETPKRSLDSVSIHFNYHPDVASSNEVGSDKICRADAITQKKTPRKKLTKSRIQIMKNRVVQDKLKILPSLKNPVSLQSSKMPCASEFDARQKSRLPWLCNGRKQFIESVRYQRSSNPLVRAVDVNSAVLI